MQIGEWRVGIAGEGAQVEVDAGTLDKSGAAGCGDGRMEHVDVDGGAAALTAEPLHGSGGELGDVGRCECGVEDGEIGEGAVQPAVGDSRVTGAAELHRRAVGESEGEGAVAAHEQAIVIPTDHAAAADDGEVMPEAGGDIGFAEADVLRVGAGVVAKFQRGAGAVEGESQRAGAEAAGAAELHDDVNVGGWVALEPAGDGPVARCEIDLVGGEQAIQPGGTGGAVFGEGEALGVIDERRVVGKSAAPVPCTVSVASRSWPLLSVTSLFWKA